MIAGVASSCDRCARAILDHEEAAGIGNNVYCVECVESGLTTRYAVQSGGRWVAPLGSKLVHEPVPMALAEAFGAALRLGVAQALLVPEELLPHVGDPSSARIALTLVVAQPAPKPAQPARAAAAS